MLDNLQYTQQDYKETVCEHKLHFGEDSLDCSGIYEQARGGDERLINTLTIMMKKAIEDNERLPQLPIELWGRKNQNPDYDKIIAMCKADQEKIKK